MTSPPRFISTLDAFIFRRIHCSLGGIGGMMGVHGQHRTGPRTHWPFSVSDPVGQVDA
jgi:hypothetical protein